MKAIMLAAGEGTRCYPFTYLSPKMFQEVAGIPLLEYMLSWFDGAPEIEKLYIAVRNNSVAETLRDYLDKRKPYLPKVQELFKRLGFDVEHANLDLEIEVVKVRGWGTGGDLRLVLNQVTSASDLQDNFLVCNADYVIARRLSDGRLSVQLNLSDIVSYHEACIKTLNTAMTVALVPVKREEATRFGVALLEESEGFHVVRGFAEKPTLENAPQEPWVNAGVYVIDGSFVLSNLNEFLPEQPNTNLEKTLLEHLANDEKPRLAAYLLDLEAWFDVGTLEQLIDANVYVANRRATQKS